MQEKEFIRIKIGADPAHFDIVFASIDVNGNSGQLNTFVRNSLGLEGDHSIEPSELRDGYSIIRVDKQLLVYVVTVDGKSSSQDLLRINLEKALTSNVLLNFVSSAQRTVWMPLMGTGAGGQSFLESMDVTLQVIFQEFFAVHNIEQSTSFVLSVPLATTPQNVEILEDRLRSAKASYKRPINFWFLQYNNGDWINRDINSVQPGGQLFWKIGRGLPKNIKPNDVVFYWRTIDQGNKADRGGLVGIGRVISLDIQNINGTDRLPSEVIYFSEDDLLQRDHVISLAGITRKSWQGSILSMDPDQGRAIIKMIIDRWGENVAFNLSGISVLSDEIDGTADLNTQSSVAELISLAFGIQFSRELNDETPLALDRESFALAIARLFRSAEREFSLALLGRWGSGKTTLANRVIKYVTDFEFYKTEFKERFGYELDQKSDTKYEIVNFNAWRYRKQPELWIWLYESFVQAYLECNPLMRICRSIRAGIQKQGFWASIFMLIMLAITAVPLTWASIVLPEVSAVIGFSGVVGLVLLWRRWNRLIRELVDKYGIVASHREHLGMQALIGDDLENLVKSWVRVDQFEAWQIRVFIGVMASIFLIWSGTLIAGFQVDGTTISDGQSPDFLKRLSAWKFDLTSSKGAAVVSLVAWLLWTSIAGLFCFSLWSNYGRSGKILLVVDDLDRCPHDEIVDLIDGIKLMIGEGEGHMGKYVQPFILADDTVLEVAIKHRFEGLGEKNRDGVVETKRLRAAVREHMEKVFLCHISLPILEDDQAMDLVSHFGEEFGIEGIRKSGEIKLPGNDAESGAPDFRVKSNVNSRTGLQTDDGQPNRDHSKNSVSNEISATNPIGDIDPVVDSTPVDAKYDDAFVLSNSELAELNHAVEAHIVGSGDQSAVTPRMIRSFLFKYQLARMLLQSKQIQYETSELSIELARAVADARSTGSASSQNAPKLQGKIAWVVNLVA